MSVAVTCLECEEGAYCCIETHLVMRDTHIGSTVSVSDVSYGVYTYATVATEHGLADVVAVAAHSFPDWTAPTPPMDGHPASRDPHYMERYQISYSQYMRLSSQCKDNDELLMFLGILKTRKFRVGYRELVNSKLRYWLSRPSAPWPFTNEDRKRLGYHAISRRNQASRY